MSAYRGLSARELSRCSERTVRRLPIGTESCLRPGKGSVPLLASLPFTYCRISLPSVTNSTSVPFAARFFYLANGITITGCILPGAFTDPIDPYCFAGWSRDSLSIHSGDRSTIGHPEISRSAFLNLKFDRARPNLVGPLYVEKDAAVASLPDFLQEGALAPFEFGLEIEMLERSLRDDVAHLGSRDVNDTVLDLKHVIRIGVQSLGLQERIELAQIAAVEEGDGSLMGRNINGKRQGGGCENK